MTLILGRLALVDPSSAVEQVGESIGRVGATIVPGSRSGQNLSLGIDLFAPSNDLPAARAKLRRQVRSLIANLPARGDGLWLAWDEDTEQNGWYVPGQVSLEPSHPDLSTAFYKLTGLELAVVGHVRTHRGGIHAQARDLRFATTPRDYLGRVYSSDFLSLTAISLLGLPSAVGDVLAAAESVITFTGARTTIDTGSIISAVGLSDLATLSWEQAESQRSLGDVVIRDRRGTLTAPAAGADTAWEEVYGPDWPFTATVDAPVIENGLCRVRYETANTDGFAVDAFVPGTGWVEQGKMLVFRIGDASGYCDTFNAARVVEWTPERAAIAVTMRNAADVASREVVYVTLQRGWSGPRFEVYGAPILAGTASQVLLVYQVKDADTNASAVKVDASGVGGVQATAGSGSALFSSVAVGAATFTGENWVSLLRVGPAAPFQVTLAVVQAGAQAAVGNATQAYGAARNSFQINGPAAAGYVSARMAFTAQQSDQAMEAEAMTLGSGTTSVADGAASNGNTARTVRTAEAVHVSRTTNLRAGKFRIWLRAKVAAGTGSFRGLAASGSGSVKTTTSTSYVWIDLGDFSTTDANKIIQINAWNSGVNNTDVDRVELHYLEDRTAAAGAPYNGARDLGQSALYDVRGLARVFPR